MVFLKNSSATLFNPERADSSGLVAIGGDLCLKRLIAAYRSGVFPWFDEQDPILWWSPDPRAIFDLDRFHVSRRLGRTIRSGRYGLTIDRAFHAVIEGCADRPEGTWITPEMIRAYVRLHELGLAHSVEAWRGDELAGGIYGVALGGLFAGESMFTRERDASKVALTFLVNRLRQRQFQLFDIQFLTKHTASLGAVEIPKKEYLARLRNALSRAAKLT